MLSFVGPSKVRGHVGRSALLRAFGALAVAAAALGPGCLPLDDLDSYGAGDPNTGSGGATDNGDPSGGAAGDDGSPKPAVTCGNGELEDGEACDDAGSSVSCAADCSTRQCGLGCRCWMEDGDLLTFCTARVAFSTAAQSCNLIGGFFNVPESAEENSRLAREATVSGYQEMWVGASDSETEGTWVDGAGEVFWVGGMAGMPVGDHYTGWETGQPNNVAMMEHCAVLEESQKWNDKDCAAVNIYSCRTREVKAKTCGDGQLDAAEFCDDGADSADCDADCTLAVCGDGHLNAAAHEECDPGAGPNPSCSSACKSTGLVLRFPLTERRGLTAYDSTDWTRVGSLLGDASFPSSATGLAVATAGALVLPSSERPAVDGEITLMALVKPSALPVGTQDIVEFYSTTEETFLRFEDAFLQVGSWVGGAPELAEFDMTSALTLGVFTHVAGTYDGTRWQLYVDGEKVAEFASTLAALSPDGPLVVAGREDLTRGFGGRLIDARVYDRALSADEILAISDALEAIWP